MKMDPAFDMLDEMLKNEKRLTRRELYWVETIDRTVAGFVMNEFTRRQREVVEDIHEKFHLHNPDVNCVIKGGGKWKTCSNSRT